jgi:dienelactone hydrolase
MSEQKEVPNVMEEVADMFGRFMMITEGKAEEVLETISGISSMDEWCKQFCTVARKHEEYARAAQDKVTKVEEHLLAAGYYHIGQLLVFNDTDEKRKTYNSVVSNYTEAIPYFKNPTERVEVPFENTTLPGYFRKRADIEKAPCVLIIAGADSSKEAELHRISENFLENGLFAFAFDGPGQAETRYRGMYMRPDYEKAASAVLDYLEKRPDVDPKRIGVLGPSFGGHLAPRSASLDKRICACISLGGFYSLAEFEWNARVKPIIMNIMGITDDEVFKQEGKRYTLDGVIENLRCPLLVINGANDRELPASQSKKIYEKAGSPKELKLYEGGEHCASNIPEARAYIVDWMKSKLKN